MRQRSARRAVITGRTRDHALELWAAAVVANGGTVSEARANIVERFFAAERASGAYALTDDYWGLWAENAAQALTSLRQRRLATAVNSPTFTTDRGYVFNGSSSYLDTGFIPSAHAAAMTGSNMRGAVYERTNVNANASMGVTQGTDQNLAVFARSTGPVAIGTLNSASASVTLSSADSRGFTVASRTLAPVFEIFKNGVSLGTATPASSATTLPTISLFIGARNNAGTPNSFKAASVGFACAGASLSAVQEAAQYANVQAWATAVGAQV